MRILFCTERIESTEWQDLVPRQRTGDCLLIHIPRWGLCDPPLSGHQTFLHEVKLRQCVFCKRLLVFWFSSRRRNFGLLGSECKYCTSLILIPLSYRTFRSLSSREPCTGACNSVSYQIVCELRQPLRKISQTDHPQSSTVIPLFILVLDF